MGIYDDIAYYDRSKLGMVNICLKAIGEAPLPNTTILEELPEGTDASVAAGIVHETMFEVQSRGWYFNTERDTIFTPENTGFIIIGVSVLRLDGADKASRYSIREGRLYDKVAKSYKFTSPVTVDVVFLIDYEDLPINAYTYIAYRAARKFQESVVGSESLSKFAIMNEEDALINLNREHVQYNDFSMLETRVTNRRSNPLAV